MTLLFNVNQIPIVEVTEDSGKSRETEATDRASPGHSTSKRTSTRIPPVTPTVHHNVVHTGEYTTEKQTYSDRE